MAKQKSVEMEQLSKKDLLAVKKLSQAYRRLREELAKVIVGQERVLDEILIAITRSWKGSPALPRPR